MLGIYNTRPTVLLKPFSSTTWAWHFNIYKPHVLIKTDPWHTSQENSLFIDSSKVWKHTALFVSLSDTVGQRLKRLRLLHEYMSCSTSTQQIRSLRLSWYRNSLTDTQLAAAQLRLEPQLADISHQWWPWKEPILHATQTPNATPCNPQLGHSRWTHSLRCTLLKKWPLQVDLGVSSTKTILSMVPLPSRLDTWWDCTKQKYCKGFPHSTCTLVTSGVISPQAVVPGSSLEASSVPSSQMG